MGSCRSTKLGQGAAGWAPELGTDSHTLFLRLGQRQGETAQWEFVLQSQDVKGALTLRGLTLLE